MSAYTEFFLNSPSSIVQLELLMISHPSFSQDFYLVRNATNGVSVSGLGFDGINLFDPNDPDFLTDYYVAQDGTTQYNNLWSATGFIPLVPGATYRRSSWSVFYAYYDENKNFIAEYEGTTVSASEFTVPPGVTYGRFSIRDTGLSGFRIVRGAELLPWRAFGEADFQYYPLKISGIGTRENLDFGIRIDLGDLGELLPDQLDKIFSDATFDTLPTVKYWTYRSDDLTTPLYGPLVLEVKNVNFTRLGATLDAKAPSLNVNRTGERYKTSRFPMLRGFL